MVKYEYGVRRKRQSKLYINNNLCERKQKYQMKKSLFALGAASVIALGAMSGSVFATDVTGESGTADAVHTVGKFYIINIPGKINLTKSTDNATGTAYVSANDVLLGVGETLDVSVKTSTGKLQASSGAVTSEIPYTVAINGGSAVNATTLAGDDKYSEIFTMAAGTTTQANTPLVLTTTSFDGVKLAAEHKDTLKSPYRRNAKFLMNDTTVALLRKLKDNNGAYLWQPSLQAGEPDRLAGYELYTSPYVPTAEASALPVAFGDFKLGYWIADRAGKTVQRLNELYSVNGQVGFVASERLDAKVILPEAIKLLKMKAGSGSSGT